MPPARPLISVSMGLDRNTEQLTCMSERRMCPGPGSNARRHLQHPDLTERFSASIDGGVAEPCLFSIIALSPQGVSMISGSVLKYHFHVSCVVWNLCKEWCRPTDGLQMECSDGRSSKKFEKRQPTSAARTPLLRRPGWLTPNTPCPFWAEPLTGSTGKHAAVGFPRPKAFAWAADSVVAP